MTTTPNEFLQFAKEMGLGTIESNSLTNTSTTTSNNNNNYNLTGLCVLNNLCHLIEQIHTLKCENTRLRSHLDLVNHVEKYLLKHEERYKLNNKKQNENLSWKKKFNQKYYDEQDDEKSSIVNTTRYFLSNSSAINFTNTHDDSSAILNIDQDQSDNVDSSLALSRLNKVRHVLRRSFRRKTDSSNSSSFVNNERIVPSINILNESDDDNLLDNQKKFQRKQDNFHDETDQDEESIELIRRNRLINSSFNEQRDMLTTSLPINSIGIDEENVLTHKRSKIARYGRKIRSKFDTVKRQFSEQSPSSSFRQLSNSHGSTFDDIGSGLNHALLTAKLAPAMTKSYQQKMRQWQTMQKSNFLVNYRRQSIANKFEITKNTCSELNQPVVTSLNKINTKKEINLIPLTPILSSNQRALIVQQWREIMSEEILLRHYNEYLQKMNEQLKQLETNLKNLKTNIFSTNNNEHLIKYRSMINIQQYNHDLLKQYQQNSFPQRSRSYQSLKSIPASWLLAVQSAAYSDILDGTSNRTTEHAFLLKRNFFNQLIHFRKERKYFVQNSIKQFQINNFNDDNYDGKRFNQLRKRFVLTRARIRKLSFLSAIEYFPEDITNSMIPLQKTTSKFDTNSHIDFDSTINQTELCSSSLTSTTVNNNTAKRSKLSRFGLKKTIERSRSMCVTQFNSWFHRRRQQDTSVPRRKSAIDPKANKDSLSSTCSSPKLFGSPRLASLHQKIFKRHSSSTSPVPPSQPSQSTLLSPIEMPSSLLKLRIDDSDEHFQQKETPVRIYLPARTPPTIHHVRINNMNVLSNTEIQTCTPMSRMTSPIIQRRSLSTSIKISTIIDRQENQTVLPNIR